MQVLLGQKYGSCPLPASVVKSQFETVRMHLVQSGNDVTLLDQCYLRDMNVVPSVYRLQNISKITGEYRIIVLFLNARLSLQSV